MKDDRTTYLDALAFALTGVDDAKLCERQVAEIARLIIHRHGGLPPAGTFTIEGGQQHDDRGRQRHRAN
jgi:hypothetical protein